MNYSLKYALSVELELSDGVFDFITKAIDRNKTMSITSAKGRYWAACVEARKNNPTITATLVQLEGIIIESIKSMLHNYRLSQEVREFAFDLHLTLNKILQDALLELKLLSDLSFSYHTHIDFN